MALTTFPPITLSVRGDAMIPPSTSMFHSLRDSLNMLQRLLTDGVLYLAYGIAILCAFKFVLYMVNGVTSDTSMGARIMDDFTFFRGADGTGPSKNATI